MASPLRNARIRVNPYVPIKDPDGVAYVGGDATKELIFNLKVSRVQKDISDGATVVNVAGFSALPLDFSIIRFMITIDGVVLDDVAHDSQSNTHPLTTATEHEPDFVDLEEACITWNNGAPDVFPILDIEHDGDGFRSYPGLFMGFEFTKRASAAEIAYKIQFAVVWSPTTPTLREWS